MGRTDGLPHILLRSPDTLGWVYRELGDAGSTLRRIL